MNYFDFIEKKRHTIGEFGFEPNYIPEMAFDFQQAIIERAVKKGRIAIFADTGLGKTLMQLEWACCVNEATGGPVIVHSPVGVRHQTKRESQKFGVKCDVAVVDTNAKSVHCPIRSFEFTVSSENRQFPGGT
jgi:superfamily II DNA or RNA helicase